MQLLSYTNNSDALTFINEDFPFSFTKSYCHYIESTGGLFFILKNNMAAAPVILKKKKFLKTIQFHFKPLNITGTELTSAEENFFLNEAVAFIKHEKLAHRIIHSVNFALFNALPDNCTFAPYGSFVIDLKNHMDEQLINNMQARYRTAIRATQKLNPEIRTGKSELPAFWSLHKNTMDRTGMYFESKCELEKLVKAVSQSVLIANCYINNVLQGGVFIMHTKYGAYYLHGASAHTTASDGAIKFLHYNCMCELKKTHTKVYDFVGARLSDVTGTKLEGIQNFKKRFGADLKKGYLWKKDISPIVCRAYDSLLHLKLSLKGLKVPKDIIDQEKEKLNEH